MRLVAKTMEKVVLEITTLEIEDKGFEYYWDKIRKFYNAENYDVYSIGSSRENENIIFIELVTKRMPE